MVGAVLWAALLRLNFWKANLFLQYGEIKLLGEYLTATGPMCLIPPTS